MSLLPDQWKFFQDMAKLCAFAVDYAVKNGYFISGGERQRTKLQAWANGLPADSFIVASTKMGDVHFEDPVGGVGKTQSIHLNKMADDWTLFKNGQDVTSIETMRPLGDFWKSLDPKNRWGGDFIHPRPDPYHFERFV